jgi:predicted O-methyltransferase YrrM
VDLAEAMTLQPSRDDIRPYFERLVPAYREYCLTVSKRSMALSIETCAYLWWLCVHLDAKAVADLGSGFSSYVLRLYASESGHTVRVASVDDNDEWLDKSERFIADHGLTPKGLYGPEWRDHPAQYDVICHDYAAGDIRNEWMTVAVEHRAPSGVVVFDDAQNHNHHFNMAAAARHAGLRLYDVYEQTVDEVGRYGAMVAA